jgi:hypothetical protein
MLQVVKALRVRLDDMRVSSLIVTGDPHTNVIERSRVAAMNVSKLSLTKR